MNNRPIGVFDSGLGGLSIWKEVVELMPKESIIYLADSGNCPYGPRTSEDILRLCARIVDFLLEKKCKLIVIACNTATSAAIEVLREAYKLPIVGLEPAIKPAAERSTTGHIGILATQGTLESKKFRLTKNRFAENVEVHLQVGKGLVEIVETGMEESLEAKQLLNKYLAPMLENKVDQIVLGCTHYPFLIPVIRDIVGEKAAIINPAPAVARQVMRKLSENKLSCFEENKPLYEFYTTGDATILTNLLVKISGKQLASTHLEGF